jgi:hypothetical protein
MDIPRGGGIVVSSSIGTASAAPMPGLIRQILRGEDLALVAGFGG